MSAWHTLRLWRIKGGDLKTMIHIPPSHFDKKKFTVVCEIVYQLVRKYNVSYIKVNSWKKTNINNCLNACVWEEFIFFFCRHPLITPYKKSVCCKKKKKKKKKREFILVWEEISYRLVLLDNLLFPSKQTFGKWQQLWWIYRIKKKIAQEASSTCIAKCMSFSLFLSVIIKPWSYI
jgi:hypothetical protein